jgi:hypothetical protein
MRWCHEKRGTTYQEIGRGPLQKSRQMPLVEGTRMVVYQSEANGQLYVRAEDEFTDGRFTEVPVAEQSSPRVYSNAAWAIASRFSDVLASETRDLARLIDDALIEVRQERKP